VIYFVYQGGSKNGAEGTGDINLSSEDSLPVGEGQAGEETAGQATGGNVNKVTGEMYVEIMAQTGYYMQKHATDSMGYISFVKALYAKNGITVDDFSAYAEELEKDPERFALLNAKYAKRLQELQVAGE